METGLHAKSNAQLEAEELAAMEERRQQARPVITQLAEFVSNAFTAAKEHRNRSGVTARILDSRRLRQGQYTQTEINAIQERGGTDLFFNVTGAKCDAFEAWLSDVFIPPQDTPWDIRPTPIPELNAEDVESAIETTVERFRQEGVEATPEAVQEFATKLYDEMLDIRFEEASEVIGRMRKVMQDQTAEGGFDNATNAFITDLATYPSAVLKGSILERRKRLNWEDGKVVAKDEVIHTWKCVDPEDFYPGPNARNVQESYICETTSYDTAHLARMRDIEGWSARAIDAVIARSGATDSRDANIGTGTGRNEAQETDRAGLENRDTSINSGLPTSTVSAIEFWGSVRGDILAEWGMKNIDNRMGFYEVNCILISGFVVRAVLNPDPLDRRPYYVSSFVKNKNSIWGTASLAERMRDCQDGVNGAMRNMMNNLALASGPQIAVDIDALPPEQVDLVHKQYAWKVYPYNGQRSKSGDPVKWYQPNSNSAELMKVAEYFEKKADDRTLVPRYTTGDEDISGAGQTAAGLSMLMNAASRGVKRVIRTIDKDVLRPAIERLYVWNMIYGQDDRIKGDAQVVPKGALAMFAREQTQVRRQEFLAMTNNPVDLEIIGKRGRASLLREIAKGLDMDVDKVVPSDEVLEQQAQAQLQAQMEQINGEEVPPDGQPREATQ